MLIPPMADKCVAYLCTHSPKSGELRPRASTFLVGNDNRDGRGMGFLTARHCIESARRETPNAEILIRMNSRKGGVLTVSSKASEWILTDDEDDLFVDLAFFRWSDDEDEADIETMPLTMAATTAEIAKENIGLGDEVFIPGLFPVHAGREQNFPLVRFGCIAAWPHEPVKTTLGLAKMILIEAEPLGGFSGSPVLVQIAGVRTFGLEGASMSPRIPVVRLLGMIHGHFLANGTVATDEAAPGETGAHSGIAMVVPADEILRFLRQKVGIVV